LGLGNYSLLSNRRVGGGGGGGGSKKNTGEKKGKKFYGNGSFLNAITGKALKAKADTHGSPGGQVQRAKAKRGGEDGD